MTRTIFTSKDVDALKSIEDGRDPFYAISFDLDVKLRDWFADEIPYGTQTGDTGTMDEWVCDNLDRVLEDVQRNIKLNAPGLPGIER